MNTEEYFLTSDGEWWGFLDQGIVRKHRRVDQTPPGYMEQINAELACKRKR